MVGRGGYSGQGKSHQPAPPDPILYVRHLACEALADRASLRELVVWFCPVSMVKVHRSTSTPSGATALGQVCRSGIRSVESFPNGEAAVNLGWGKARQGKARLSQTASLHSIRPWRTSGGRRCRCSPFFSVQVV